jgi:phage major head subunit gpT-like protein
MIKGQVDLLQCLREFTLAASFERAHADPDAHTVPLTISTDSPVRGPTGMLEVLRHDAESVDLTRAQHGLPLQVAHQARELPVGRVEGVRLDGTRLRGVARFSRTDRGQAAWQDVSDGIIRDVSVGALIDDESWQESEAGGMLATRWQPVEVSLVSVGADPGAGINREAGTMYDLPKSADVRRQEQDLRTRAEDIGALFAGLDGPEWITMERDALRGDDSLDVIRARVMDRLKSEAAATVRRDTPEIRAGEDGIEKWAAACEQALDVRFGHAPEGIDTRRLLAENELAGMSLREMARDYLRARGVSSTGSIDQVVRRALGMPSTVRQVFSHSTSDFSNLLAAGAEKSLSAGYTEAPETFRAWTRNVNMSNFRAHSFTNLSLASDLSLVVEGAEFTHGTFSDRAESATLATYGKLFSITRQAIINDDLDAFVTIPNRMGRAAARQVGDLVYAIITADVVLSDQAGATLFNTTDGNLAASGAAISTTTMDLAFTALGTMTDPSGATINVEPAFLLVPKAKETTARTFIAAERDPAEGGTTSFDAPNIFRNRLQVVAEPRLDADSTTQYYVLGRPGAEVETVIVGWLNGRQEPTLEQMDGFNIDGTEYKVRIDCTAKALDWRGMYSNAGA